MESKKVLIVDDDKEILELLAKKMKDDGYLVLTAALGQEGIEKAKSYKPDVILLDIVMPDIDGAEAVNMLKEDPITQYIPVVFLSGLVSEKEGKHKSFTVNVGERRFDAIPKPFRYEELAGKMKEILK